MELMQYMQNGLKMANEFMMVIEKEKKEMNMDSDEEEKLIIHAMLKCCCRIDNKVRRATTEMNEVDFTRIFTHTFFAIECMKQIQVRIKRKFEADGVPKFDIMEMTNITS